MLVARKKNLACDNLADCRNDNSMAVCAKDPYRRRGSSKSGSEKAGVCRCRNHCDNFDYQPVCGRLLSGKKAVNSSSQNFDDEDGFAEVIQFTNICELYYTECLLRTKVLILCDGSSCGYNGCASVFSWVVWDRRGAKKEKKISFDS